MLDQAVLARGVTRLQPGDDQLVGALPGGGGHTYREMAEREFDAELVTSRIMADMNLAVATKERT